jgi:hypothetical protein
MGIGKGSGACCVTSPLYRTPARRVSLKQRRIVPAPASDKRAGQRVAGFFYDIPARDLAFWFAALALGTSLVGVIVLKPVLRALIGREPGINATIANATTSVSLLYGLLISLLTVAAYQNRDAVQTAILDEAAAVAALYADMDTYPEPLRSEMRGLLRDYVQFTIHKDWPAHQRGEIMNGGAHRADAMRQRLARFEPATDGQRIVHAGVVSAFRDFANFRQSRLNGVDTRIPDVLWYAVFVGALVNIVLLFTFRLRPFPHFVLGLVNVFFLGVVIFVILALDDPLRGERSLSPAPFERVWERQMSWHEDRR